MLCSFHLLETTRGRGLGLLAQRQSAQQPPGLRHAETMTLMELGAPIVSPRRVQLRQPAMFAAWETAEHLEACLADDPPRTISTFTVWATARAMTDMVGGQSDRPHSGRHAAAMRERERRDFHVEFTTLRFRCRSEHGSWQGHTGIVPTTGPPSTA